VPGFSAIPKVDLAAAAVAQIRDSILIGDLAPGAELPSERELAIQLGLNRTTVREALTRLELFGLIDRRHGKRCQVLDFRRSGSVGLLPHLARLGVTDVGPSIREAISIVYEGTAVLAARRRTEQGLADLERAATGVDQAVAAADHAAIVAADREFHHTVAAAADSITLELIVSDFYRAFDASIDAHGTVKRTIPRILIAMAAQGRPLPHRQLADAIADGDEEQVRTIAHFIVAGAPR
jgi:GntR family transcriptional regulator, transcriptional repressor for pyruvate dehydrogenase complex